MLPILRVSAGYSSDANAVRWLPTLILAHIELISTNRAAAALPQGSFRAFNINLMESILSEETGRK